MPVQLTSKISSSILADEMEDGDIAVITKSILPLSLNRVVMRWGDCLIVIGQPSSQSWPHFFAAGRTEMQVRILQPGEQLTIV